MRRAFALSLALLVGGLVGYLSGRVSHQSSPAAAPVPAVPAAPRAPSVAAEQVEAADSGKRSAIISTLIRAERDPWGALADLERRVEETAWHFHSEEFGSLYKAWAQRDIDGAIAGLDAIEFGSVYEALRAVLDVAFEKDPAMAAELMKEWKHYRVLPDWLKEHPAEACRLLPQFAASQDGADHFSFPRAWVKIDPGAALEWAQSLKGWQQVSMVEETIQAWAYHDLDGAIAAYGDGSGHSWQARQLFAQEIARGLGRRDPARAFEWLAKTQLDPDDRQRAKLGIVRDWSKSDLDGAIEWMRQQPPIGRKQALGKIAYEWVDHDVEAAAQYYLEVGPTSQSDRTAAETIGKAYVKHDPAAALDWVDRLQLGTRAGTELLMLRELFKSDREMALAEFNSRVRRLSVATVERFSADFFKADPGSARVWLNSLPRGLAYELANKGLQAAAKEDGNEELKALARELKTEAP